MIKYTLSLCLLLISMLVTLSAQTSIFQKITAAEGATIVLETNRGDQEENRMSEKKFPGFLTTPDGVKLEVELSNKGRYRRLSGEIPPIKVKFSKKDLRRIGLDTMNEIKLVLPFSLSPEGNEWIIREYLAYKMWERLSPFGIRAGLVQLTLVDTRQGDQRFLYCLVLEHKEETLARLKAELIEDYGMEKQDFNSRQLALMAMFQYMIGNTDWDLASFRNLRLLRTQPNTPLIPIPYDFDFSGLVDAPYAKPASEYRLQNVRQRHFMVSELPEGDFTAAAQTFIDAKADLLALCRNPLLPEKTVQNLINYLEDFYKKIPDCKNVQCLGMKR